MRKVDGGKRPGGVVACGEDCFFLLFLITSGSPSLTSLTPPSFLGCLSDTVEIIWEERREQQKLSTVIVCINHSACIHSERKKKKRVLYVCTRHPLSLSTVKSVATHFLYTQIIVKAPVHLVLFIVATTQNLICSCCSG